MGNIVKERLFVEGSCDEQREEDARRWLFQTVEEILQYALSESEKISSTIQQQIQCSQ